MDNRKTSLSTIHAIYNRNALREDIHYSALFALGTRPPAAFSPAWAVHQCHFPRVFDAVCVFCCQLHFFPALDSLVVHHVQKVSGKSGWKLNYLVWSSGQHRFTLASHFRLQAVSLLSWSVEQNARDTQMTTCVTEGAPLNVRARVHSPLLNLKKKRDCSQSTVTLV